MRAASLGDEAAALRLLWLTERQPSEADEKALRACADALVALFSSWWALDPQAERLVAKRLAVSLDADHGNFWAATLGEVVWVGRGRNQNTTPACLNRLALLRWARARIY